MQRKSGGSRIQPPLVGMQNRTAKESAFLRCLLNSPSPGAKLHFENYYREKSNLFWGFGGRGSGDSSISKALAFMTTLCIMELGMCFP